MRHVDIVFKSIASCSSIFQPLCILVKMKVSKFTIPFVRNDEYFLYNTLSLSLIKIDKPCYNIIEGSIVNPKCLDDLDSDTHALLQAKGMIDDNNDTYNKDFRIKMEYLKRLKSFGNRTLSLVIAPTLACNFACPYCYEANLPLSIMGEDVEDKIIDFINSFSKRCDSLEICWEGGEPLLGIDRIKSLLNKIKTKSLLPLTYHSIITNGYLFSEEIAHYFSNANLNFIQITIDGQEDTHNKSRILKNGGDSYKRIISNIDLITQILPKCLIVVRTNVHEGNKSEFGIIYKDFCKRWEHNNVRLFPAFVMPNTNCKVSCCTPQNKTEFFLNLKRNEGIDNINFVPRHCVGSCSATSENSYVIAPDGRLYKCWNDIGIIERSVGDVSVGINNNTLVAKYMIGSDKYSDSECTECSLFPICDGGCNRHRIDNAIQSTKYPLCPFTKDGVADYLYEHYKSCKDE